MLAISHTVQCCPMRLRVACSGAVNKAAEDSAAVNGPPEGSPPAPPRTAVGLWWHGGNTPGVMEAGGAGGGGTGHRTHRAPPAARPSPRAWWQVPARCPATTTPATAGVGASRTPSSQRMGASAARVVGSGGPAAPIAQQRWLGGLATAAPSGAAPAPVPVGSSVSGNSPWLLTASRSKPSKRMNWSPTATLALGRGKRPRATRSADRVASHQAVRTGSQSRLPHGWATWRSGSIGSPCAPVHGPSADQRES